MIKQLYFIKYLAYVILGSRSAVKIGVMFIMILVVIIIHKPYLECSTDKLFSVYLLDILSYFLIYRLSFIFYNNASLSGLRFTSNIPFSNRVIFGRPIAFELPSRESNLFTGFKASIDDDY
jgi:hypothetical protein